MTPPLPTLAGIRAEVERRAARIDAPPDLLPTYGRSEDFARPHIEVDRRQLHWVLVERGLELERRSTTDLDQLLYWVFAAVVSEAAGRWELRHRQPGRDPRRLWFARRLEEMARLDPAWRDRLGAELDAVLRRAPLSDR